MTFFVEAHPWRGISFARDLFHAFAVVGWVTVGVSRYSLMDRIRELNARLRALVNWE